jgi:hypothetical protein
MYFLRLCIIAALMYLFRRYYYEYHGYVFYQAFPLWMFIYIFLETYNYARKHVYVLLSALSH